MDPDSEFPSVVELNVGGVLYTTSLVTLTRDVDSMLGRLFTGRDEGGIPVRDPKGRYFLDRDGVLFRYILDFLRNRKLVLPDNFHERDRLRSEAEHFDMAEMVACLDSLAPAPASAAREPPAASRPPGHITIGYRGSFSFGLADVNFRKLTRILVCGRVALCREVFGDSLNESRDPDQVNEDRYTARFFLKHMFLEQAFDSLQEAGFRCAAAAGSGTSGSGNEPLKPGTDYEENRWNHYNEFVFVRP